MTGDSFEKVPPEALAYDPAPKKAKPTQWWKEYKGDLKRLDIQGLFKSEGLRVASKPNGELEIECPWAHEHTSGGDLAYVRIADPGRNLFPSFHCFHDHCKERTIEDVLALFGKEPVENHCRRHFNKTTSSPLIDPTDPMETARAYHGWRNDALTHHRGEWWRWDGHRYQKVSEGDIRAELWKWIEKCKAGRKPSLTLISTTLDALKSVANLSASVEMPCWLGKGQLHSSEDLIAFDNGLLDLEEFVLTGELRLLPLTPRWFSDNCLTHEYDSTAACPNWLRFLRQIFEEDNQQIVALAQWFGYCLTRDIRQQKFALFIGLPRSGKGTVLRILNAMLGPQNVANPSLTNLATRFGLASLEGKLGALIGDAHLGRSADSIAVLERLKGIVGGDPQNVEQKYAREKANVTIAARFTIATNELPRLNDASAALKSRMLVFPFNLSFEGQEDYELGDRLVKEIQGITNWALQGLLELRRKGRFSQPPAGQAVLADFDRLSSPVRAFLADCCEIGREYQVTTEALRAAWEEWCEKHGNEPGSDSGFGNKLRSAGHRIERKRRRIKGAEPYVYVGVQLVSPAESGSSPVNGD